MITAKNIYAIKILTNCYILYLLHCHFLKFGNFCKNIFGFSSFKFYKIICCLNAAFSFQPCKEKSSVQPVSKLIYLKITEFNKCYQRK